MGKGSHCGSVVSKVWTLVEKTVKELGFNLWDIRFEKEGSNFYLKVFIDKKCGITIEDCEKVSKALDKPLDDLNPIEQSYCFEVCSPGLERELTREEHFQQFIGEKVFIRFIRPNSCGEREIYGVLEGFNKDEIKLSLNKETVYINKKDIAFVKLDDFNN